MQFYAGVLCFIDRVNEKPGILLRCAPRGEARAFGGPERSFHSTAADILDRGIERRATISGECKGASLHFRGLAAASFSQQHYAPFGREIGPAERTGCAVKVRYKVGVRSLIVAALDKPSVEFNRHRRSPWHCTCSAKRRGFHRRRYFPRAGARIKSHGSTSSAWASLSSTVIVAETSARSIEPR
jgi:hypothetical protein